jgi:ABC-2 type transport system permease protein
MPDRRVIAGQLGYQARLLARTPRAAFGGVALPVMLLALREPHAGPAARSAAVAALAVLGLVSTAYVTHAIGLVTAREAGVLKRWRATPLPPVWFFAARVAATVVLAVAGAAVTVAAGDLMYGVHPSPTGAAGLLLTLTLGAVAWAAIGTAACALIGRAETAWPVLGATYLPVMLLSGGLGTTALPGWLATVTRWLPAQPLMDAAGRAFGPHAGLALTARDAAVLAAWTAAGLLVSARCFRWQPRDRT